MAARHADDAAASCLPLHLQFERHGQISRQVLVAGEGEAPSRALWERIPGPAESQRRRLRSPPVRGILHVAQAELDRIGIRHQGELIHRAFNREHIGIGPERP